MQNLHVLIWEVKYVDNLVVHVEKSIQTSKNTIKCVILS